MFYVKLVQTILFVHYHLWYYNDNILLYVIELIKLICVLTVQLHYRYCNNLVTPSLNESLEKFLSEIRRLQTKLYNRDQNKGKYKRRYYSGLKEVQKHILLKKVQFVVIAPDIEKILSAGKV